MTAPRSITSRSNPQWQRLRKLAQDASAYRQQGEVWVEGEHLCREVVQRGRPIPLALIGETAWERPALRDLVRSAADVLLMPDALMAGLSAMDSPPPLAFVLPWAGPGLAQRGVASVVLDRLQDAGNVGTVLRSAAAFGFSQVIALKGSAALWSPKVLRAGMGAHWALNLVEATDDGLLADLGVPLLATSSHAERSIHETALPWPCAWLLGHEGQGLAPSLLARCDQDLRIPQPGGLESLNVAAAAAVCLYESARQRMVSRPAA